MRKELLASTTLAIAALLATGAAYAQQCTPKHTFETISKGELTVALTNTAPYSEEKASEVSGIDGNLLKRFAADNCLTVKYEIFSYPAAVSAVQSNRADVAIGGFYRTAKRERVVTLSTPVYLDQLSVASKDGIDTVDQLIGKRAGTVEGYLWVPDMEKLIEGSKTYPNSLNLAQDLQAGRLDAALDGFGAAVLQNKGKDLQIKALKEDQRIDATLNPSQTSFLLPKGNDDFVTAINESIEAYRKDGVIAQALTQYGLDPSAADVGEGRVIN